MSNAFLLRIGAPVTQNWTNVTFTTFQVAAATSQMEWIFPCPADDTSATAVITALGYRLSSIAGTSPAYKISLQSVDTTTGFPTGTILGGGSPASHVFTPAGSAGWYWQTLDNAYTANRGDFLAIVIAYSSGTINASNAATFAHSCAAAPITGLPYAIQNAAGVRTKQNSPTAIYGYQSASLSYGFPIHQLLNTGYSSNSNPNEVALAFSLPAAFCATYQVIGARWALAGGGATGTASKMILYDSGTNVLQSLTWPADVGQTSNSRPADLYFPTATLATLSAGVTYRLSLQPQATTAAISPIVLQAATAADFSALPGGTTWFLSTRNGGAWTDVPAQRPACELILAEANAPIRRAAGLGGGIG